MVAAPCKVERAAQDYQEKKKRCQTDSTKRVKKYVQSTTPSKNKKYSTQEMAATFLHGTPSWEKYHFKRKSNAASSPFDCTLPRHMATINRGGGDGEGGGGGYSVRSRL